MFYVKQKISEDAEIRIDITDENVFTRCTKCGKEIPVNIEEMIGEYGGDLYGTTICCSKCSQEK